MKLLLLTILAVGVLQTLAQDATKCGEYPTCHECISHNLCGWCGVPVVYNDGTRGPYCAGKPEDPDNPPPGYKPWTCPKDFQNDKCYGYICSEETYACESAGAPGKGVPLQDCMKLCIPPTYECNSTTAECFKVLPGHGTDKTNCERQCLFSPQPEGPSQPQPQGHPGPEGPPSPQPSLYLCNTTSLTCDTTSHGGIPKPDCESSCGKPHNVTPVFVIGEYRGLEINHGYEKGEWQARITQDAATFVTPSGKVWEKGVVRAYNNELWLQTNNQTYRGIFGVNELPEVQVLTWGFAYPGAPAPVDFDHAMQNGIVFVFAKCLVSPTCNFHIFQAVNKILASHRRERPHVTVKAAISDKRSVEQTVNDPCSDYPDCHSCITAPEFCGWCSVPILYNSTILGKNCAGLNTTITPRINCTGTFSTEDCSHATTGSTTSSTTSASTGSTSGPVANQYECNPVNATCTPTTNGGGQPLDVCTAQCKSNPFVPPSLQGKVFRGLEIQNGYVQGEWRAKFSATDVTIITPQGVLKQAQVAATERFMTVTMAGGPTFQTIWQTQPGPSSLFLSWAWGMPNDQAPSTFDEAMTTNGEAVFWFVSCLDGKPLSICDFSQ